MRNVTFGQGGKEHHLYANPVDGPAINSAAMEVAKEEGRRITVHATDYIPNGEVYSIDWSKLPGWLGRIT